MAIGGARNNTSFNPNEWTLTPENERWKPNRERFW